jgi:hypothetical protein
MSPELVAAKINVRVAELRVLAAQTAVELDRVEVQDKPAAPESYLTIPRPQLSPAEKDFVRLKVAKLRVSKHPDFGP